MKLKPLSVMKSLMWLTGTWWQWPDASVVNTFVYFFAPFIGHVVDRVSFKTNGPCMVITLPKWCANCLGFLASMLSCGFPVTGNSKPCRWRKFSRKRKMIGALRALQHEMSHRICPDNWLPLALMAWCEKLFMSHPPLEERIAALQKIWRYW